MEEKIELKPDCVYSLSEASSILIRHKETVRRWICDGKLSAMRSSGGFWIWGKDIIRFMNDFKAREFQEF